MADAARRILSRIGTECCTWLEKIKRTKMGCFTVSKRKKKKIRQVVDRKPRNLNEYRATALPEPEQRGPSLQSAPPSFRVTGSRHRVLSAPSPDAADGAALSSLEFDEQEESKGIGGSLKEERLSNPLPLPLPSPQSSSVLGSVGSFKSSSVSNASFPSGPLPLPPLGGGLRIFSFEEISVACQHFSVDGCLSESISSTVYQASFGDDVTGSKKLEATVTYLLHSTQVLKEFLNDVTSIASLQHPQLCKLLGFHAREGSYQRMLVYERLFHGSLDQLLCGRSDGPSIDWSKRMKVALCAAQGLTFLHEEGPFQAMYSEFSTANIQIDKDFTGKLSGYGCANYNPDTEISNTSAAVANLPLETLERGLLTPKSNVWSFGIVLLELLTGRRNFDSRHSKEDSDIIKWSRPFLADDCRLSLIMDPRLKGRFPLKGARTITDIALRCLQKEPSERPTMRAIVEALTKAEDIKYSSRFPLQEPLAVTRKQMLRSPSLNAIFSPAPRLNFSSSPPSRSRPSLSPSRKSVNLPLPPRTCASPVSLEDNRIHIPRPLPSPTLPRPGVEGF